MRIFLIVAALLALATPSAADLVTSGEWPRAEVRPERAAVTSSSPFGLSDVADAPATEADVAFYKAVGSSADAPAPAVILLHGAGGVSDRREGALCRGVRRAGRFRRGG